MTESWRNHSFVSDFKLCVCFVFAGKSLGTLVSRIVGCVSIRASRRQSFRVLANSPQPGNANANVTFDHHNMCVPRVVGCMLKLPKVCD